MRNCDWEQRKLGEVSEITKLAGFEFTKYIKYSDTGHIPAIRGLNVKNGNFVFNDVKYIDESDFSKLSRSKLFAGDIVFTYVGTIGEAAIIPKNVTWYLAPNVSRIRTTELNPTFLLQLLINPVFRRKEIETWIATSSQPALSMENIRKFEMNIPSHKEQTKIGKFFNNLDKTIALHQRKVTLLKRLKEAYLTRMLPQNSENIPLLRFADYFDPWEQRKLEDLAESFNYGLNASAMEFDGENKYIRITDIDEYSHRFIQSGLTSPNTDLSNANDYLLKEGDILFARTGASVGKSYQYDPLDGKVYYAGFLIRARIKPEFDSSFIFQNTLTEKYNNFIKITSQRSGQPGVNAQEYANFSIMVPSRGEQVKLGNFFKQLDNAIALHQCKIEKLAEAKKVLLAAMFV